MLQLATPLERADASSRDPNALPQLDVLALLRVLQRHWRLIAAVCTLGLCLGVVYLFTAKRMYTANFSILVTSPKGSVLARDSSDVSRLMDPGIVESQVEVLKSDSVALQVVRALDLTKDLTVMGTGPSWLSQAINTVVTFIVGTSNQPPGADNPEQTAVQNVTAGMKVERLGATYVVQATYVNSDATRAAKIANGIADAYLNSQLEAQYQARRRTADWLQARLNALRNQTSEAELAVQMFKANNGIVDTARGLITDQQLSDANAQLAAAHDNTTAAKANYDRIGQVLKSQDAVNATVPDALKDDVLNRLRARYLDISSQASDLATRFGPNHGAVVSLRNQMIEISKAARDELGRIAESLKSTYEAAAAKEIAVRNDLKSAVGRADTTNMAQVKLRDLESQAQTYRNLYDNMLDKLQEATQEQTSPDEDARIITPAAVPDRPSSPKLIVVIAASLIGSFSVGCGIAVLGELMRNSFKNAEDVKTFTGLECIGTLPLVRVTRRTERSLVQAAKTSGATVLGLHHAVARYTLLAPFSRFTETIRSVKVSIELARTGAGGVLTGVVSAVPKEGKTTVSANLAFVTAQMGHKVLLIDGDMHNPSLTRTLMPSASWGLIDVLEGSCRASEAAITDTLTGLAFIPCVVKMRKPNAVSLLTSEAMKTLLASAREEFDFVIIDLPPVVPVVDVKASAAMFDSFVFITEWGRTSREVVRDALILSEQLRERVVGVILNKADVAELRRMEAYRGPAYDSYYVESDAPSIAA